MILKRLLLNINKKINSGDEIFKGSKSHNLEKAIIFGFLFSILISFVNFAGHRETINNKILRLHIIANSDSEEDQNFKLQVRDKLLKLFKNNKKFNSVNIEQAKTSIQENMRLIQEEINKNIPDDSEHVMQIKLCKSVFASKTYKNITLPSGLYNALMIRIGASKGKNWFCVIAPPMCTPAAQSEIIFDDDLDSLPGILNAKEISILETPKHYEIRFKIIDFFEYIQNKIHDIFLKIKEKN
ncbi:MAG: stage II sporulation protein R [Candidatus Improbicoccus devescovinae]|nr:MAG: stage II sporulation protein R [Candidatus Improbicoccus devescovinae]